MVEKTVPLTGWPAGANNIAPEIALPDGAVRAAVNMDFHDSGKPRRRDGYTKVRAETASSVWAAGESAFFVEKGDLMRLNRDYSADMIRENVGDNPMQYLAVAGEIYYSNGIVNGKIVNGQAREWGVEQPTATPSVTAITGFLPSGTYQLICTYTNKYGEESGCRQARVVELSGGARITFPQPTSPEIVSVNLYMSPPDGDALYFVESVDVGQTLDIRTEPSYGHLLRTQFMERMLPGELLEYYRGVIYVSTGNIVWYSEPNSYGLYRPAKNYIIFPKEVTVLGGVQDGMYVASDTTWYLEGDTPDEFKIKEVLPYGAAKYSKLTMRDAQSILWRGDRGLVRGDNGGVAVNLQEGRLMPEIVETAAMLIREVDSIKQVISVGVNPPYPAGLVASDYWEAEIIRQRI